MIHLTRIEAMERLRSALNRAATNNTVINVLLAGCFGLLVFRSVRQQKDIEILEAERNSLLKANKAIKTTIWNSKQDLYADATSNSQTALIPLSKLKAIYGDATPSPSLSGKYTTVLYLPGVCF
jgi:hypothetical protein